MKIEIKNNIVTIDDEVVGRITGTTCETTRKLSSPVRGKINTLHGTKLNYIHEEHVQVDHAGFATADGPISEVVPAGSAGPRPPRNPRLGNHDPALIEWLKKGGK